MAACLGLGLGACPAPGMAPRGRQTYDEWRTSLLVERAAFDLACPKDQLRTQELGSEYTMGVTGCERRAVYLWDHGHSAWLMNGTMYSGPDAARPEAAAADTTKPTSSTTREDTSGSSGGTTTP